MLLLVVMSWAEKSWKSTVTSFSHRIQLEWFISLLWFSLFSFSRCPSHLYKAPRLLLLCIFKNCFHCSLPLLCAFSEKRFSHNGTILGLYLITITVRCILPYARDEIFCQVDHMKASKLVHISNEIDAHQLNAMSLSILLKHAP